METKWGTKLKKSGRQSGTKWRRKRGYAVRDSVADKVTNKAET